ncbi:phytanoyl-CoA dioxygenase family protein [Sulfuriflexus sp.]|uniref:phytanoyl-CoA dioxygenase family protein n=1 Tax=Sulfuriflexus sp. TaxID=2015443 RepID=UPI0028CEDC12|nr:phytanoyl-CoA dioxygenase family protein [Sulfuriflexus sp.]MDT8405056.1 phytanoyl-CoA dioxygenase family protein [Sulfuriflexus sp.]
MTPEQRKEFHEKGYIYIPGALSKSVVLPVRDHVFKELKRLNIWSTGRTLSQKMKGVPVFQQTGKLGQLIGYRGLNDRLISQELYSAMCLLADAPLHGQNGQLLISLPHQIAWTLEGLNWHRDISKSQMKGIPGIQAFILLDNVAVKGGATLALAGSHRLQNQVQAKQGISELISDGVNNSVKVGDVELLVLEMAGHAGDVYLMDMRVLHTPSVNSTKNIRIMATARYFAE